MMWFWLALFFAFWTSIAVSVVKQLTTRINPRTILFVNNLFILPFMLLLLIMVGGFPKASEKFFLLIMSSSLLDVIAGVVSIWAIAHSPISLILPMSSFNPVFTTIIAAFTLTEVPTMIKFAGMLLIVAGSYLLNIADIRRGLLLPFQRLFADRGVQAFLLANFLWAITPTFQKQAIYETTPLMPLFPSFVGSIFVALLLAPFVLNNVKIATVAMTKNLWWFLLLAPFSALAQWAAFTAFSQANVGYVTAIFKLSVLFTILLGWLIFGEERIKERLLGGAVMLLGTVLLVL